jgi:hypothetical protein
MNLQIGLHGYSINYLDLDESCNMPFSFKISAILIDVLLTQFSLLSSTQLQKLMFWKQNRTCMYINNRTHINDPLRVGGGVHECIIKQ